MIALLILGFYISWGFYYQYRNRNTWDMILREAAVDQMLIQDEATESYFLTIKLYLEENYKIPREIIKW